MRAGLFLPLTESEQARITAAAAAAGFPPNGDGVRRWILSQASKRNTGAISAALSGAASFARENPQVLRDGLTLGRAILALRK